MKKVSVFGLGYVGTVTAACLAHMGAEVIGLDINPLKVTAINEGRSPIIENETGELIAEGHRTGRLYATSDASQAVFETDVSLVCVATPSQRNGRIELSAIRNVCAEIGAALRHKPEFHTIAIRSTVAPGTTESVVIPALETASGKRAGREFAVCMNPEFIREGTAVNDFFYPPFTIVGAHTPEQGSQVTQLYAKFRGRIFETPIAVAETVKYACNAYHALKVCFDNEMGTFCEQAGVDAQQVMEIFASDTKLNISSAYLMPGFAFGGSCLPKDLRSLNYRAKELDLRLPLLDSILPSNAEHIERAVQAVLQTGQRRIGMLGLSFKAGTDDLRESPFVHLIKRLIGEGCEVRIWDDQVSLGRLIGSNRSYIEEEIPHIGRLLCEQMQEVVTTADIVLIGAKSLDRTAIADLLRPKQIVIDLMRMRYAEKHLALVHRPAV